MTLERITRTQLLPPEEAAKYRRVREQVEQELPELVARHHERRERGQQPDPANEQPHS